MGLIVAGGSKTSTAARASFLAVLTGLLLVALAAFGMRPPAAAGGAVPEPVPASCTPLDLAFVVDDSGSMDPPLDNVKAGINNIIDDATIVGAGNLRIEVISYEVTVDVDLPFSLNNEAQAKAAINALQGTPSNPANNEFPEASDEGLRTAVYGLPASARSPGQQNGDAVAFRPEAEKIIIFVGDALPAGFDDAFTPGVDDTNAFNVAVAAQQAGIRITSIYTPDSHVDPGEEEYYGSIAAVTGGQYTNAGSSGAGTAAGIQASVNACGAPPEAVGTCKGKQATRSGTPGNDRLVGTGKRDIFAPGAGNDKVVGKGGKDLICAGPGNDKLKGGGGNDKMFGGGGKDRLGGGGGKDRLKGGGGRDRLIGGPGKDKLKGGGGKDVEIP